jgi:hypothetical protein
VACWRPELRVRTIRQRKQHSVMSTPREHKMKSSCHPIKYTIKHINRFAGQHANAALRYPHRRSRLKPNPNDCIVLSHRCRVGQATAIADFEQRCIGQCAYSFRVAAILQSQNRAKCQWREARRSSVHVLRNQPQTFDCATLCSLFQNHLTSKSALENVFHIGISSRMQQL